MHRSTRAWILALALLCGGAASSQELRLQTVAEGLSAPLFAAHAPGDADRLFVVLQGGQIVIVRGDGGAPVTFLDIRDRVTSGGERGLLGMAFHPDYGENGHLYVNYTATPDGQLETRISRFTAVGGPAGAVAADPASEVILLTYDQPFNNHNAGMLAFSPADGYLYIGTGDGGSGNDPGNRALDLSTLLGKMLRIDVDLLPGNIPSGNYAIPADNPYVLGGEGEKGAAILPEIWASGLRNPFRYSFDRATGDLWIGDVGQNAREEVNFQPVESGGGENYGWRVFEGTRCNTTVESTEACDALEPEATFPVHEYANPAEGRAVTGGYVYRGSQLPDFAGRYFFSDGVITKVWSFDPAAGSAASLVNHTAVLQASATGVGALVGFGEDSQGELYLVSLNGKVFKLVPRQIRYSADRDGSGRLNLSELLRIIQFYNSTGLHCAGDTEDGFALGAGNRLCTAHSADYAPQDWSISLSELLRTIELYNLGDFEACPQGEDGFCSLVPTN
jgi:glucose/arabinose dehydrogenase